MKFNEKLSILFSRGIRKGSSVVLLIGSE